MKVKDSPLYKATLRALPKELRPELAAALERVDWQKNHKWAGLKARHLCTAFAWRTTPQGFWFWSALSERAEAFHAKDAPP